MSDTSNTAIFGGSFNPVHLGHLAIAEEAIKFGYGRVIFVPAKNSPFKNVDAGASAEHRITMLKLALKDLAWAVLWEGEIIHPGPSRSIDTVDDLKRLNIVSGRPGFIIGNDIVPAFPTWKEAERLAAETSILLMRRHAAVNGEFPYPHQLLPNPLREESSTEIRKTLAAGGSIKKWVPQSVDTYIHDNRLYGAI